MKDYISVEDKLELIDGRIVYPDCILSTYLSNILPVHDENGKQFFITKDVIAKNLSLEEKEDKDRLVYLTYFADNIEEKIKRFNETEHHPREEGPIDESGFYCGYEIEREGQQPSHIRRFYNFEDKEEAINYFSEVISAEKEILNRLKSNDFSIAKNLKQIWPRYGRDDDDK